jgi:hypothetical protein
MLNIRPAMFVKLYLHLRSTVGWIGRGGTTPCSQKRLDLCHVTNFKRDYFYLSV